MSLLINDSVRLSEGVYQPSPFSFMDLQANSQLSGDQQLELRYASAVRPSSLNGI